MPLEDFGAAFEAMHDGTTDARSVLVL
jgi:hypothetical protein